MKIDKHIKNLEEYCQDDDLFEKDGDFKEFCDGHIADIKAVIQELKNTQADLYEANNRIVDYMDIIEERDRIIDLMAEEFINKTLMYNDWLEDDLIKYFEERCKDAENKS